jgi:hypothetical protein
MPAIDFAILILHCSSISLRLMSVIMLSDLMLRMNLKWMRVLAALMLSDTMLSILMLSVLMLAISMLSVLILTADSAILILLCSRISLRLMSVNMLGILC